MNSNLTKKQQAPATVLTKPAEGVYVITMNRPALTFELIDSMNKNIDEIEASTGLISLILTSSHPKIFCAGFDLNVFDEDIAVVDSYFVEVHFLYARLLKLGGPTIAAINGHCVAGGVALAFSCDFRFMTSNPDLQVFMNEAEIGLPFPPATVYHIRQKLANHALKRLVIFGEKFSPQTAKEDKIVDNVIDGDLMKHCIGFAETLKGKSTQRLVLDDIKKVVYDSGYQAMKTEQQLNVDAFKYFVKVKKDGPAKAKRKGAKL